ncbi:hypothetical protein FHP29_02355 [Nocardioides albidus]|uniref:Uncharacterized protein n=1 Tax=Nocardioides albidus TaxID=1517589 RepID=A0A5C4WKI6_9ACTN|nr:hypothetical protein [Nocardioides albidus]TNM48156.1 hypothetical protein FHP29_02355 [Nocardioides albidus]
MRHRSRPRRSAQALGPALCLLLLGSGLAACGDDDGIEAGDVVPARPDAQITAGANEATIALPTGNLVVQVGDPVQDISAGETRQLEKLTATEGEVFVPVSWHYDAATLGSYARFLETSSTPTVDLIVDGASYRIPPPDTATQGQESFFVTVSGSGERPALEVEFDGVVQTADLATGEVDPGAAAPLYGLSPTPAEPVDCGGEVRVSRKPTVSQPSFSCTMTRPLLLPYAGDSWAADGHSWLALTVETALGRWDEATADLTSGAVYYPTTVDGAFTLGGAKAVRVIRDPGRGTCPDIGNQNCSAVFHVLFDVGEVTPGNLVVKQTYQLGRTSTWGAEETREQIELKVTDRTQLPKPARD